MTTKPQVSERVFSFFSFKATLYPCPETSAERREMVIGVSTRIEDVQSVSHYFKEFFFRKKFERCAIPNVLNNFKICFLNIQEDKPKL